VSLLALLLVSLCVCVLLDISPLPASTVPAPANHFAAEALPSTAAAQQTVAETPRKLVDAAEVKTLTVSVTVPLCEKCCDVTSV